ncbi:transporter substrate-binding domain-containing protein [Litoribacillus peritrichatus]|uniref:Transporter substrate-binding domain-containing protein n=1 Tax=Litoribacillus peritrichatus TaxID=718191 RepID=A0ABP7ML95_9GAMM
MNSKYSRRQMLARSGQALLALSMPWGTFQIAAGASWPAIDPGKPVKVGLVLSSTGFMGVVEPYQIAVLNMAIEEANAAGGINGAKIVAEVRDPGSDWSKYASFGKELLDQNINIFHSCYTSASRESMLPVLQRGGALLFYPTYYEGRECSSSMILTGSCPNQQVDNSVPWMINKYGGKVYLIGSNYIYPRTMNKAAKLALKKHGGVAVGEQYIALEADQESDFQKAISDIKAKKADWVLSNVVGASNDAFMRAYKKAGLTAEDVPIMSYPLTEPEVHSAGIENCVGHYTSFTYFQSIDTPENKDFVARFTAYLKANPGIVSGPAVTSGVMQAAYSGFTAFIEGARKANSVHPKAIVAACRGLEYQAPEGKVKIDSENLHTHLRPRIGRVNSQGLFDIVDESADLVRPEVFSAKMDPGKECKNGGEYLIKGRKVPAPKVTRKVIPQA